MKKRPWWLSLEAKELLRSANMLIGGFLCGLNFKSGWYMWAGICAAWSLVCLAYLIGIYIDEASIRILRELFPTKNADRT